MSKPVDDVYLTWYYERPSYDLEEAVGMLKKFQELDFTYPKQHVYINVFLDMTRQKKVGWKCIQILMLFFFLTCEGCVLSAEQMLLSAFSAATCSFSDFSEWWVFLQMAFCLCMCMIIKQYVYDN